jgi:hypothetical protein
LLQSLRRVIKLHRASYPRLRLMLEVDGLDAGASAWLTTYRDLAAWSDDKFELPTIHAKSELLLHGRNGNSD